MARTYKKRDIAAFIINLFLFVCELVIIVTRIPTLTGSEFSYYTLLSNLMGMAAAVVFMLSFFSGFNRLVMAKSIIRYYATCMLAFTFIIVITVLTPMALSVNMNVSFLYIEDTAFFHHVAHPVLSFISFVFLEDNKALKKKQPALMLLITLCYAAVLIILNLLHVVVGPYPFLQVYDNPVWATIIWIIGLTGFNYLINFLIYRAGSRNAQKCR